MRTLNRAAALAAVLALALVAAPRTATACGGFFCQNQPMDQVGEKIAFSIDGDTVTAAIQIQFEGSSPEFSWVLPLPSEPANEGGMDIGTEELFTALLQRTSPTFTVQWEQSECTPWWGRNNFGPPGLAGGGATSEDGEVEVLQVKEVGPYVATVVKSEDPAALSAWLKENDYDLPDTATPLIAYYVQQGNVFLALKLQQDKGAGDIAPIVVKFKSMDGACIPLVLTQIAAQPDMPVYAWILDGGRTVPKNFFHVEPNLAQVSWLDGGQNYVAVVTQAVNEAAGHGFVTDFAGASSIMKENLYFEGRFSGLENLKTITDPAQFYGAMLSAGLPVNAQTQGLIKKHIPVPAGWTGTDQEFYQNLQGQQEYLDTLDFDPLAFVADIEAVVVEPVKQAQAMLDSRPYLTRLFTTVSPEDMNRDPIFVVDETLPEVPVERVAKGTAVCGTDENGQQTIESVILTLPDGTHVSYAGAFPRYDNPPAVGAGATDDGASVEDQPYAGTIEAWSTTAGGLQAVEREMVPTVDQELALNSGQPPAPGDGGGDGGGGAYTPVTTGGTSGGCSAGALPTGGTLAMLLAGLFALATRRRKA